MGSELIIVGSTLIMWVAGCFVLSRMNRPSDSTMSVATGQLSIIIPARNEERNLPKLLSSIQAQRLRPFEVLVANDHSTDRTAEVARDHGARVVDLAPLPAEWRGKTWACYQGALESRGELLMFLDADTWFEDNGLERAMTGYRGGARSVCPYHVVSKSHERLSLFFNIFMVAGTVPFGLFGQMLLIDRESYFRVNGHEAVKKRVLENVHMASVLRSRDITTESAIGRNIISFRMYPDSLRELIEGWTRGFVSGAARTSRATLACLVGWLSSLLSPLVLLLIHRDPWMALVAYLGSAVQVGWYGSQVGSFGWATALAYPVPLFAFFAIFFRALLFPDRRTTWKGREIRAD